MGLRNWEEKARCEYNGKVVRRAAAARALPRRRCKPRRDLRFGTPPRLATAASDVSNHTRDAIMDNEHNIGIQFGS